MAWDTHDEDSESFQTEDGLYAAMMDPVYGHYHVCVVETGNALGEVVTLKEATRLVAQHRASPHLFAA